MKLFYIMFMLLFFAPYITLGDGKLQGIKSVAVDVDVYLQNYSFEGEKIQSLIKNTAELSLRRNGIGIHQHSSYPDNDGKYGRLEIKFFWLYSNTIGKNEYSTWAYEISFFRPSLLLNVDNEFYAHHSTIVWKKSERFYKDFPDNKSVTDRFMTEFCNDYFKANPVVMKNTTVE